MIGLDTNVILRYVVRDDPQQYAQSARLIDKQLTSEEPGFISLVVTTEIVWNLMSNYEFSREDVIRILERLLSIESLTLQNASQISEALAAMRKESVSFPDALIRALSFQEDCLTTYTFDRKASRFAGFTLLS